MNITLALKMISNQYLIIYIFIITASHCAGACLNGCFCEKTKITCENVDVTAEMLNGLQQLPKEVTEFYLRGNNLNKISSDILKNLKDMKVLEISSNNIQYIPINTFKDFTKLEKLILNRNELKKLSKDMFTGLENLFSLDLSQNNIAELTSNVFEKLKKIEDIRLGNNELTVVPNSVFSTLKSLRILFLTRNLIHEIEDKAFENLSLYKLGMSYNQLKSIPPSAFKGFQITGKILLLSNQLDCSCKNTMNYAINLQHLKNKVWGYCSNPFSVRDKNILEAHALMFCSMCDLNPCKNRGECTGNKTKYQCKCDVQYKGDHCEIDICYNKDKSTETNEVESKNKNTNFRGSRNTENRTVINHTEYVYLKQKVTDKDSETKLIILYTMCTIEFIIILGFIAYIGYKRYREWKEEKEYNLKKTTHILFGVKNQTNAKLSKALYDTDYSDIGYPGKIMMYDDGTTAGLKELMMADDSVPL